MDIVLIPGLWLNASCWDEVTPRLEAAGHRVRALTLPGMESTGADRSGVGLQHWIDAVVAAIDDAADPVLLVGHSAGCGLAHAALDARPERVVRVMHIGGFPAGDGEALLGGLPAVNGEVRMPDWVEMGEEANVRDMDAAQRKSLYDNAIPVPVAAITTPVRLRDGRRFAVPMTLVCPEYTTEDAKEWATEDDGPGPELRRTVAVDYVDIGGGHWPQLTQPERLAQVILGGVPRG
ncbi:alpha/beta hydrolase [Calidifontibacter sp. DB0510]|uniref:Alpha/beta hydrolase n=1 Tax=Metallococcus carri TaxID=1656884 RepID=A0A967AZL8_9MICO|nr:alpha/beta hydrolase [Metallococcus carri]NHN54740.1 alpha/beta hydrolase [Metallococcus carri]NOP37085.1 alpha/beta hydrolase [Calidifontibacter sp. DB2511S]